MMVLAVLERGIENGDKSAGIAKRPKQLSIDFSISFLNIITDGSIKQSSKFVFCSFQPR